MPRARRAHQAHGVSRVFEDDQPWVTATPSGEDAQPIAASESHTANRNHVEHVFRHFDVLRCSQLVSVLWATKHSQRLQQRVIRDLIKHPREHDRQQILPRAMSLKPCGNLTDMSDSVWFATTGSGLAVAG